MNHRFSRLFAALIALGIIASQFLNLQSGTWLAAQPYSTTDIGVVMLGGMALIAAVIGAPAIMLLAGVALFVPGGLSALDAVGADRVLLALNVTYLACAIWNVWQGMTTYHSYESYGGY